jgi:hypothetical protein
MTRATFAELAVISTLAGSVAAVLYIPGVFLGLARLAGL